jgi:pyrroline-5-carboxylate reductase
MTQRIAFIGAGNMAGALIGGLLADGMPADQLIAADPDPEKRAALGSVSGIATVADNGEAVVGADTVVLAVKPQVLRDVVQALAPALYERHPLVLSIAAGIRCSSLQRWLGRDLPLVRAMPNTPAIIQTGATALFATPTVSAAQREQAESLLRAVGLTCWVDEEGAIDAVTALSGSGPAYHFMVMEAMEAAAIKLGLSKETARLLNLQTALGAARMALESTEPPDVLRQRVTSPGGTTEAALAVLQRGGLAGLFEEALTAARDRSVTLSDELGGA